jgi:hypothetical protein
MTCSACSAAVEQALLSVKGVSSARVALLQELAEVGGGLNAFECGLNTGFDYAGLNAGFECAV